jgi:hypothetical protein
LFCFTTARAGAREGGYKMRFGLGAGLVLAAVVIPSSVSAVPSFTRQTGLTCNQCHITFSNVPDFTFTGKKFRLNGYRTPYVAEKIEAGEEGALSGNRLMMGIQNIYSLRFRNTLLTQSKPATATTDPVAEAGPVTSTPGTSISWFYVGGIGENIGLWNEFYLDASGNVSSSASPFRLEAFDEYDLKFVVNPGYDNIVGFSISTQSLNSLAGFSPFNSGTPNNMQRGGIGNAHTAYVNLAAYTLIKDRVLAVAGVQTGEDNYSFSDGMNFQTVLGYALGNTDHNQLWLVTQLKAGNDAIPIVSTPSLSSDRQVTYRDAITGVTATRGNNPAGQRITAAYDPTNSGDFVRTLHELHYGFVDHGPHSLSSAFGFAFDRETYDDGAEIKRTGIGGRFRYYYDRTWGVEYSANKNLNYQFTDRAGTVHDVSNPANFSSVTFYYRPAMNFSISLGAGINRTTGTRLDDNRSFRSGWSWNIGYDFMF